jgi:hypothetical protein
MTETKKDYCENTEGNPAYGLCKQKTYHHSELHLDHKDGNPFNDTAENTWTICSNCHERKTHFMGDHKTKGRGVINPTTHNFNDVVDFIIRLFKSKEYLSLRRDLRRKYFINPLKEAYGNNLINCLQGPVSFGKTYGIFVEAAPYHFSQGGRVHIALSPMTDSQGLDEISDYVYFEAEYDKKEQRPRLYHSDQIGGINWIKLQQNLENGDNVTIVMSDQYYNNEEYIQIVENIVKNYSTLLTRDEASYGMLSTWEISKTVTGNKYTSSTKQAFYHNFMKLFKAGAHSFAITATPTKEMINTLIGANWNMANKIPNTTELIPFRKWYRNLDLADWSHEDYSDKTILSNELNNLFAKVTVENIKIKDFNKTYTCSHIKEEKITAMIVAQPAVGSREKILIDDILDFIGTSESIMNPAHTLIVATGDGWVEYNSKGTRISKGFGEEYQDKLKSSNEKAHYLVVINKAVYGVNINTLGFGLIFRQYQNEDEEKESITLTAQQLIGRFNRTNFSNEKIVYLCEKFGPHAVYEYFSIAGIGCFDIKAPKSQQFETAFSNFKESHGTHLMDAMNYLFKY